jgi:hypothetical protein
MKDREEAKMVAVTAVTAGGGGGGQESVTTKEPVNAPSTIT